MSAIEIKNVSKRFGEVQALDNVSLCFGDNRIYGLLGRNGAGKSTLLGAITGRIFTDSGQILIDGESSAQSDCAAGKIYLMGEANLYPDNMKVFQALKWTEVFYPGYDAGYAAGLCEKFKLSTGKKIKSLSTGYRSIFKIITALSSRSPYIFLDEPVLGLDANYRDLFYRVLLQDYAACPRTIVISTHLIEEVAPVIEQVVIIDQGRILRDEPVESILTQGYTVAGPSGAVNAFLQGKKVLSRDMIGGLMSACVMEEAPDSLPDGLEMSRLDLQKLFIHLTGEEGGTRS